MGGCFGDVDGIVDPDDAVDGLGMQALGLGLSDDKRQLPSQRVIYTGMVVDSFLGTISIPPEKKARLAEFLED